MKKIKKIYCGTSFAFGTVTLLMALFLLFGQSAYATTPAEELRNRALEDAGTIDPPNTQSANDTENTTNGVSVISGFC